MPISVGIVGGGIGGCCLAIGLLKHGINVTVYESTTGTETLGGAGIVLQPNGLRAIELIDEAVAAALIDFSTRRELEGAEEVFLKIRSGETDEIDSVGVLRGRIMGKPGSQVMLSRTRMHEAIIKALPPGTIRYNKSLNEIHIWHDGSPLLEFTDGSIVGHTLVVGCDGIHSKVRSHILGPDSADAQPCWSGKYMHRCTVPMVEAIPILGEQIASESNIFIRDHQHMIIYPVEQGTQVSIGLCGSADDWTQEEWMVPSTSTDILQEFNGWSPRLMNLLAAIECTRKWALFDLPHCQSYCKGRVAIMGDAAHASTPFLGAGASMAAEDALVLVAVITAMQQTSDSVAALEAFNALRRSRTQKLVMKSREACQMLHLEHPEIGHNYNELVKVVASAGDWFWHTDLQAHVAAARKDMRQRIERPSEAGASWLGPV